MTTPEPDERRREKLLAEFAEFPCELPRCTCSTPSFNPDDHADI